MLRRVCRIRLEPINVIGKREFISPTATTWGTMTNDPLISAYYYGCLRHTLLRAYGVAHYACFLRPRKQA